MRRQRRRAYGPYPHRRQFRVVVVQDTGKKVAHLLRTQAEALELIEAVEAEVGPADAPTTIEGAIDKYEVRRRELGRQPTTLATTSYRLKKLLEPVLKLAPPRLTPERCAELYRTMTGGAAVDTHRNALAEAKTFAKWMMKQHWTKANPWAGVEGEGERKAGPDAKPQLRIDEARRWMDRALELGAAGKQGAIAALLTVTLGLRCSEIIRLAVRDVDDGGTLLWVAASGRGKTKAARRQLTIPAVLRPLLKASAKDKLPAARLLGEHYRKWPWSWVRRICAEAKVPLVCAHAMRGLYGTLGMAASSTPELVAASLGHTSPKVTMRSYADKGKVAAARAAKAMEVLEGGRTHSRGGSPRNG